MHVQSEKPEAERGKFVYARIKSQYKARVGV